jgi:hypothetical protein
MSGLGNRVYFPPFHELPLADDIDMSYWSETDQGMLMPSRTWCAVGEIVNDALSQMPNFGNRVEVRDMYGDVRSVLFYPEAGSFDFSLLRTGHTLFIRYAQRCVFSDLMTEAIKVEDLSYVKVIPQPLDALLIISNIYFERSGFCSSCGQQLLAPGCVPSKCSGCHVAAYCCQQCHFKNLEHHLPFCRFCKGLSDVFNIDYERFTGYIPFR